MASASLRRVMLRMLPCTTFRSPMKRAMGGRVDVSPQVAGRAVTDRRLPWNPQQSVNVKVGSWFPLSPRLTVTDARHSTQGGRRSAAISLRLPFTSNNRPASQIFALETVHWTCPKGQGDNKRFVVWTGAHYWRSGLRGWRSTFLGLRCLRWSSWSGAKPPATVEGTALTNSG